MHWNGSALNFLWLDQSLYFGANIYAVLLEYFRIQEDIGAVLYESEVCLEFALKKTIIQKI